MSETFRVGDHAIIHDVNGDVRLEYGILVVDASDVSTVRCVPIDGSAGYVTANAGTLRIQPEKSLACVVSGTIARPTEADLAAIRERDVTAALRNCIGTALQCRPQTEATLRAAYSALKGDVPQCSTCAFWRPPFDDYGPGNCHNQKVRELTKLGNDSYPPPTPAEFGCNQWKAKQPPENGDDSDE